MVFFTTLVLLFNLSGENVHNGDHSEAHLSTFSHSSKEVIVFTLKILICGCHQFNCFFRMFPQKVRQKKIRRRSEV